MGASASIIASIEEVQYSIPNNLSTTKPIAWTGARTKNEWKVPPALEDLENYNVQLNVDDPSLLPDFLNPNILSAEKFQLPVFWRFGDVRKLGIANAWIEADCMNIGDPTSLAKDTPISNRSKPHCPFPAYYPLYFVPGSIILHLERIPKHEELLMHGLLVKIETTEPLRSVDGGASYDGQYDTTTQFFELQKLALKDKSKTLYLDYRRNKIFLSHRWKVHEDGTASPDDKEMTKLQKMKTIVKPSDLVWFDYMCIPQISQDYQLQAIQSLPHYIGQSDVVHILATDHENYEQYKTRAFTNLELVCASMPVVASFMNLGYGSDEWRETTDAQPFCKIYDPEGNAVFPFMSPHKANMFNREDLPKIISVLKLIENHCHVVLKESMKENRYTFSDSGMEKKISSLLALIENAEME